MTKSNNQGVNIPSSATTAQSQSTQSPEENGAMGHGAGTQDFLRGSRRTARSIPSAPLNALFEAIRRQINEDPKIADAKAMLYNGEKDGSNLSGVAVFRTVGNNVVMSFVASKAACDLSPREVPIDDNNHGRKVSMQTNVPDLYHPRTIAAIKRSVLETFGAAAKNLRFHNAGLLVMTTGHQATGFVETAAHFANIAYDQILDFEAHLRISNEQLFSVDVLKNRDPRAVVSCQPQQTVTLTGEPRRADITVSTSVKVQGPEGMVPMELTRTSAFINFIYRKPKKELFQGRHVETTQCYQPEIVITDASAVNHANTLESMLYATYAVDAAITNHRWLNMYKHNYAGAGKNAVNEYNLGALNIETPHTGNKDVDGKAFPTGDATWVKEGLYMFAEDYFLPTIGKAIIVPESGPNARLLGLLRASIVSPNATEDQMKQAAAARQAIIRAGDNLTGNHFSKRLGNAPLFLPTVERTLIGTYVEDGEKKDLNHIDHVAMLNNFGNKELDFVYRYEDTFTDRSQAEALRLNERITCVKNAKGSTVEVEEFGYLLRFTPHAQMALAQAISDNSVNLSVEGVGSVEAQPERGAGYLSDSYGVQADKVTGFQTGGTGGAGSMYGGTGMDW